MKLLLLMFVSALSGYIIAQSGGPLWLAAVIGVAIGYFGAPLTEPTQDEKGDRETK